MTMRTFFITSALIFIAVCFAAGQAGQGGQAGSAEQAANNRPSVTAKFVPDSVMIGDHFYLEVEVEKDIMQLVEFPTFEKGVIAEKMEILLEGGVDTISNDGRRVTLGKKYLLTCFDAGMYRSGRYPLLFAGKNITDTVWSADSLRLFVGTFQIDTLTQTIYDSKPTLKVPLLLGEVHGYIIAVWLLIVAILAAIYFIRKYIRGKGVAGIIPESEPPHVKAIRELEKLHSQKLWQSGKTKQYYTSITDILREYLEQRYSIPAMESTSQEIMSAMEEIGLDNDNRQRLSEILLTADYVKFAKHIPGEERNEASYNSAYYFVEETKPMPVPEETEKGEGE